jgi:NDP-4-keto-2,6-dideoxyhexose 3-C-methyltransferase
MPDVMPNVMIDEHCHAIDACRICGSTELVTVIDLGEQYIATHFVSREVPDFLNVRYPLHLVRCASNDGCGLVQLKHSVDPAILYIDYGYRSGINQTMRDNLAGITNTIAELVNLESGDTVLDIGCNDGTLLASYKTPGLDRLGIDPSTNVLELAREKGLAVVNDFFSAAVFKQSRPNKKAKVVTSIAMFYDLERPGDFVRDVASILSPDGIWVIELSYLPSMLERNSYDTICHEHLEYYSLATIEWLLRRHGLQVQKIGLNEINGGSFRLFIRPAAAFGESAPPRELEEIRKRERELGLKEEKTFARFRENVDLVTADLRRLLGEISARKQSVYVYGASTKGNTILQFCGVDVATVPKAADRNPDKWGRRTLGTNIEIISESQARAEHPDYFMVLPWHFFEEFLKREVDFLASGGKFILPLPEVRVIGKDDA